jgi:hypothetical protein
VGEVVLLCGDRVGKGAHVDCKSNSDGTMRMYRAGDWCDTVALLYISSFTSEGSSLRVLFISVLYQSGPGFTQHCTHQMLVLGVDQ